MTSPAYTVTIAGTAVTSSTLAGGTITYGRQRVLDTFTPAIAFVRCLNPVTPWSVGDTVTIAAGATTRFDGRISALVTDQEVTSVQAVSEGLGYLAAQYCPTFTIGDSASDLPYLGVGIGLALYRSSVITFSEFGNLIASGSTTMANGKTITVDYRTSGPQVNDATTYGDASTLDTVNTIANNSSLPLLYETPAANVEFDAPSARSGTSTTFALNPGDVLRNSSAEQNVNSLINRAIVSWDGGSKTITDLSSVASYGRRDYSTSTQLLDLDDVALKASRIVGSNSIPYWQTNPVTVLVNNLTLAQTVSLYAAKAGSLVNTAPIASLYPGMEDESYIEGWAERFGPGPITFDLYLSPWSMTRKPESWQEVTASLAWNGAAIVGLDWLDLIRQDI